MMETLSAFGSWSVGGVWIPVLVWTVLAGGCLFWIRRARTVHPLTTYRIQQGVLFALPLSLLAARWLPASLRIDLGKSGEVFGPATVSTSPPVPGPSVSPGAPPVATEGVQFPVDASAFGDGLAATHLALGFGTVAAIGLALVSLAVMGWKVHHLHQVKRSAKDLSDAHVLMLFRGLQRDIGLSRVISVVTSSVIGTPMTFWWGRQFIAIPDSPPLDSSRLTAVFTHELIHVRRRDFEWGLLERVVVGLFAFHPLAWAYRRSIEHAREASCDLELVASQKIPVADYATLLVETASAAKPTPSLATAITAPSSNLRRRLETMKHFQDVPNTPALSRSGAFVAVAVTLCLTAIGACTAPPSQEIAVREVKDEPRAIYAEEIAVDEMAMLEAQVLYLEERMDRVRGELEQGYNERLQRRYDLLLHLYDQRLERYEVARMLQATGEVDGGA